MNLTETTEKIQLPYATFNRRIYAMTIDVLLFMLFATPFMNLATGYIMGETNIPKMMSELNLAYLDKEVPFEIFWAKVVEHHLVYKYILMFSTMIILLFIYEFYFWVKFNSTIGKMLFSCKFVDVKTGDVPTKKQYFLRFVGYVASTLPLYIGFFAVYWSKHKQSWHDSISGIAVVVVPRKYVLLEKIRSKIKEKFGSKSTTSGFNS